MVVQLLGGNDGLNTVVPHGIDGYNRGRTGLAASRSGQVHKITPEIGLHPAMGAMAKLLEKGRLAVVQGVGYPNPDRSHFRSMEIWETGRLENDAKALETGWLGRALDAEGPQARRRSAGLHVGGRSLPLALRSREDRGPRAREPGELQAPARRHRAEKQGRARRAQRDGGRRAARDDPLLGFISRTTLSAYESSSRLEQLAQKARAARSTRTSAWRGGSSWSPRSSRPASAPGSSTRRSTASTPTPTSSAPTPRC